MRGACDLQANGTASQTVKGVTYYAYGGAYYRPYYSGSSVFYEVVSSPFQTDPYWRDHLFFYEYFHGDNGAGIGASHQTGWTGLVPPLIEIFGHLDAKTYLEAGRSAVFERV